MRHIILLLTLPAVLFAGGPLRDKVLSVDDARRYERRRLPSGFLDQDSAHAYDQQHLTLSLRVENDFVPLVGTATIVLTAIEAASEIWFNAEGLTISSVREGLNAVPFLHESDTLRVQRDVTPDEVVTLIIDYSAPPNPNHSDVGFQSGWEHCFTFSEPYGARRWMPCFDQPFDQFDDVTISVDMPEHWSLASNGELIATSYPEPGRKQQIYEHHHPITTYLIQFAAGSYAPNVFVENGVQYRYFAWPQDSMKAAYDWERTPQMTSMLENWFGDYPFEQYGMVETHIMNGWGAMEHQTMTTYGHHLIDSARTFEYIVAHELAHQWWGDFLSPVDFRNMWLNEGFATYGDCLWREADMGEAELARYMNEIARYYIEEDRNQRYAIYDPPSEYLFGAAVYFKGAWVLHMLRKQILGDSLFSEVMHQYREQFGGGTVSTEDFIQVVNDVHPGEDVRWFFDQWVHTGGHPQGGQFIHLDSDTSATVRVTQGNLEGALWRFPMWITWQDVNGAHTDTLWFDASMESSRTLVTAPGLAWVSFAPDQHTLFENIIISSPRHPDPSPGSFVLGSAYPNPFNASVTIPFELNRASTVSVDMFDISGRLVAKLADERYNAGSHTIHYDASPSLSSGVYVLRAKADEQLRYAKLLLLK